MSELTNSEKYDYQNKMSELTNSELSSDEEEVPGVIGYSTMPGLFTDYSTMPTLTNYDSRFGCFFGGC